MHGCLRCCTAIVNVGVQCSDLVLDVLVLEAAVGSHGPQVVRVPADNPRASLRVVFALDTAVQSSTANDSVSVSAVTLTVLTFRPRRWRYYCEVWLRSKNVLSRTTWPDYGCCCAEMRSNVRQMSHKPTREVPPEAWLATPVRSLYARPPRLRRPAA
jgi:hypothetical protein